MNRLTTVVRSVNSDFYCCIRPEGLLYDAERDLLAIAKFVVLPRPGPDVVFFLVDFVAILVTVKTNYS